MFGTSEGVLGVHGGELDRTSGGIEEREQKEKKEERLFEPGDRRGRNAVVTKCG